MRGAVTIVEPSPTRSKNCATSRDAILSASASVAMDNSKENIAQRQRMIDLRQELSEISDPMAQIKAELASIDAARARIAHMKETRRQRAEEMRMKGSLTVRDVAQGEE